MLLSAALLDDDVMVCPDPSPQLNNNTHLSLQKHEPEQADANLTIMILKGHIIILD